MSDDRVIRNPASGQPLRGGLLFNVSRVFSDPGHLFESVRPKMVILDLKSTIAVSKQLSRRGDVHRSAVLIHTQDGARMNQHTI